MSQIVENFLKNKGFNQKDIQIYLDIFKHGQSYVSSIAGRTGIDRTTVYSVVKRLLKQGIISQTKMNDVRAYMPISAEVFIDKVDRDIDELKAQRKAASLFASELTKLGRKSFLEPKIKIYEGDNGVINLYEQTLKYSGDQQKSFLTIKSIPASLKKFLQQQFIESKKKKNVFSRVLIVDNKVSRNYKELDFKSNRETRLVKKHAFDLYSEIVLYGGKNVAIIDFHQQIYGLVIESETLFKTMEALFDLVWSVSEN